MGVTDERASRDTFLAVARVLRPRGRKGEVVAEVLTDFPERFRSLRQAFLECPGSDPVPAEIIASWWHQGRLIVQFAGVDSISQAERLRDRLLLVPRHQRVALRQHQYYCWELIGCRVISRSGGELVGEVVGVESTAGADLLRVARSGPASGEVLVPLAQEICPEIDVRARRIVIEPPEGLLDLND